VDVLAIGEGTEAMHQLIAQDIATQRAERAERRAIASVTTRPPRRPERPQYRVRNALAALRRDLAATFASSRGEGYRLEGRRWVVCC
jgi:hypothetical protein